jgi:hypothetical protein
MIRAPRRAATNGAPGLATRTADTAHMTDSKNSKKLSGIPPCPVHSPQGKESHIMSTHPTSRRAVLAGVSALPAATLAIASVLASAPALASGGITVAPELAASASNADPIFLLIKQHRRAESKFNSALHKLSGAQSRFQRECGGRLIPEVECDVTVDATYFGGLGATPEVVVRNMRFLEAKHAIRLASTHEQIDEALPSDPDQAARCHSKLARMIARYNVLVGPHLKREDKFGDASNRALDKLFEATATTPAGIRALISYAFETNKNGLDIFQDGEAAWGFLEVINRSLANSHAHERQA